MQGGRWGLWWETVDAECSNYHSLDCRSEKKLLVRPEPSDSFGLILKHRTTVALLPELIMFQARKQLNQTRYIGVLHLKRHVCTLWFHQFVKSFGLWDCGFGLSNSHFTPFSFHVCFFFHLQKWERTSTRTRSWIWNATLKTITNTSAL